MLDVAADKVVLHQNKDGTAQLRRLESCTALYKLAESNRRNRLLQALHGTFSEDGAFYRA